jgi:hypothetical protein
MLKHFGFSLFHLTAAISQAITSQMITESRKKLNLF